MNDYCESCGRGVMGKDIIGSIATKWGRCYLKVIDGKLCFLEEDGTQHDTGDQTISSKEHLEEIIENYRRDYDWDFKPNPNYAPWYLN